MIYLVIYMKLLNFCLIGLGRASFRFAFCRAFRYNFPMILHARASFRLRAFLVRPIHPVLPALLAVLMFAPSFGGPAPGAQSLGAQTQGTQTTGAVKIGVPVMERMEITYPEVKDGASWIRSDTRFSGLFAVTPEQFRRVLTDFESYPTFIPRLVATKVAWADAAAAKVTQRYEINILGYRYPTEYTLQLDMDYSRLPSACTIAWSLIQSDGSVGGAQGQWQLDAVTLADGSPGSRVVHSNVSLVKRDFPLQVQVMRMVAEKEMSGMIQKAYEETLRRLRS
jgi:hypothetical protein